MSIRAPRAGRWCGYADRLGRLHDLFRPGAEGLSGRQVVSLACPLLRNVRVCRCDLGNVLTLGQNLIPVWTVVVGPAPAHAVDSATGPRDALTHGQHVKRGIEVRL